MDSESFDNLLDWLGPTREEGARKYEDVRTRLIRILRKKGCSEAEDVFDETVNRVTSQLPELKDNYVGNPLWYFISVANIVFLEWLRKTKPFADAEADPIVQPEVDAALDCLRQCLNRLSQDQRELVLDYHVNRKRAKIELHRKMAEELGVSVNALRLRAHRIRTGLEKCVLDCLNGVTT